MFFAIFTYSYGRTVQILFFLPICFFSFVFLLLNCFSQSPVEARQQIILKQDCLSEFMRYPAIQPVLLYQYMYMFCNLNLFIQDIWGFQFLRLVWCQFVLFLWCIVHAHQLQSKLSCLRSLLFHIWAPP